MLLVVWCVLADEALFLSRKGCWLSLAVATIAVLVIVVLVAAADNGLLGKVHGGLVVLERQENIKYVLEILDLKLTELFSQFI